ncbi:acylneuraminate cytidylyltransferase family protein [Catalinimonas niigatensis]|uniref:acylneuraminate cytidylyltransferase family protein n=1 Tax=Catalinimonas niigatensis TaxID=1397264 RepID=UPI0026652728|nr:acylneuraminate cytidylyltransferase family protein [Catalinimonas niigatensis]WPP52625.1 acylneuraminate cytidylyltransferase family protein [Catalinimonas niigatensis]
MSKKVAAIVPMRHNSERVLGKNYRLFAGKPLYHHVMHALIAVPGIHEIIIDTDSPNIMEDAAKHFPQVKILERPDHLRDGGIPMNDVLLNIISQVESDFYLQTHSTNPLLSSRSIDKAVQFLLENYPIYDSLFGVTRLQTRLWDSLARPVNHNAAILLRTQDLPPIYEENSCIYIFTEETLRQRHNRIGERPYLFEISKHEAHDIDIETDFLVAETLYKAQQKNA